jgi:undecaprenyl-diphosphatase
MFEKLLDWDQETLIYLNNLGSQQFDIFWYITTNFLTWIPLFLFISILLFRMYGRKESFWIALSFISMLTFLVVAIIITKESVGRLRPINNADINMLLRTITRPSDYSFFSGHAASSFSIATLAFLYLRKKLKYAYLLLIWPILFSFSRMYLGVHYPLDILVGMLVGILFAYIFYRMHQKFIGPYIM